MGIWSDAFIKACLPRPRISGSEWADTYGQIPPPAAEAGPFRTSRTPYIREILDVATDRTTREVVFIAGSQVGKTQAELLICGYYMVNDPTSIMVLLPSEGEAEVFSKTRLDPMIKATPVLRNVIEFADEANEKDRKTKSTTFLKRFIGGFIAMPGAVSPRGLASRAIKVLLADEVDRYPFSAGREGSPLELAKQRTATFHDKKQIYVSTPTIKGESLIDELFEASDQRYFHIACQHCGEYQKLEWQYVKWDRDADGKGDPETARYECRYCEGVMRGAGRPVMSLMESGKWIAEAESKRAGFHVNSLYSPFWELRDLVAKFLDAVYSKDRNKIMQFKNLQLGEAFEDAEQTDDHEHVYNKRREYYGCDIPKNVLLLTAAVDVQNDRLEAELVGWGHEYEQWSIQYRVFMGDPGQNQVWKELDAWLLKQYQREDGLLMNIKGAGIDSGGHFFTEVLTFCKAREQRRIFAFKGSPNFEAPLVPLRPTKSGRMNANLWVIGVSDGKSQIYSDLKIETEGPRYIHFPRDKEMLDGSPRGYELQYFDGLFSEKKIWKIVNGQKKPQWKAIKARNEPLDLKNYNQAIVRLLQPDFAAIEANVNMYYPMNGTPQAQRPARRRGTLSKGVTI